MDTRQVGTDGPRVSAFGLGCKVFGHLGDEHVQLEPVEAIQTAAATHLRYRILHQKRS